MTPLSDPTELLKDGLAAMGIPAPQSAIENMVRFQALLLEWNQKMNLTAITDPCAIVIKHFLDSASVLTAVPVQSGTRIVDVGSGAGFPGIPIKLLVPKSDILLVDALMKRVRFLETAAAALDLKGLRCLHTRAEDFGRDARYRARFDVCVSRAVAKLSVLSEYCLPLVRLGGLFVSMKGPDVSKEIAESEIAVETLGGAIEDVKTVLLPHSDITHTLILIKKYRQTSRKYPRNSAAIAKTPII